MRTVKVSPRAKGINALLEQARKENIILCAPDGSEFVLAEVDDFNRDVELTRQNKELMRFLEARAKQTKTLPLVEAKGELGLS